MSAKVKFERGAWWVFTHYERKRKKRRVGTTAAHKREAEEMARKINAALALGTFQPKEPRALPFGPHLRDWHRRYSVTFKPRYQETSLGLVEHHLVPFFGKKDLREIGEADLLDYIGAKVEAGHKPATILNALSIVRRVLNLAVRDDLIVRNPANGIGRLIARVARREDSEVPTVEAWSRAEVETLLAVADEHEPRFAPLLRFLVSTGCRAGRHSASNGKTSTSSAVALRFVAR